MHTLLGLRVLNLAPLSKTPHYSSSSDDLEILVRIARYMCGLISSLSIDQLDSENEMTLWFSDESARRMWRQISSQKIGTKDSDIKGSHSFHIIITDSPCNVVTRTNTISSLPWDDGLFVEVIPLNSAGKVTLKTRLGERTANDRAMHMVFRNNEFVSSSGAFNTHLCFLPTPNSWSILFITIYLQ